MRSAARIVHLLFHFFNIWIHKIVVCPELGANFTIINCLIIYRFWQKLKNGKQRKKLCWDFQYQKCSWIQHQPLKGHQQQLDRHPKNKLSNRVENSASKTYNSYQKSSLSYGHNTRISNEKLDKLSIKLKSIFKLKDQPILKKKSNVDKRQKIIVLSKEFREIKITLK